MVGSSVQTGLFLLVPDQMPENKGLVYLELFSGSSWLTCVYICWDVGWRWFGEGRVGTNGRLVFSPISRFANRTHWQTARISLLWVWPPLPNLWGREWGQCPLKCLCPNNWFSKAPISWQQGPVTVSLEINVLGMLPVAAGMCQGQDRQEARPVAKWGERKMRFF